MNWTEPWGNNSPAWTDLTQRLTNIFNFWHFSIFSCQTSTEPETPVLAAWCPDNTWCSWWSYGRSQRLLTIKQIWTWDKKCLKCSSARLRKCPGVTPRHPCDFRPTLPEGGVLVCYAQWQTDGRLLSQTNKWSHLGLPGSSLSLVIYQYTIADGQ